MAITAIAAAISAFAAGTTITAGTIAFSWTVGAYMGGTFLSHLLISTAVGLAMNALAPKPTTALSGGYVGNAIGANRDRQIVYGQTKVGGVTVFQDVTFAFSRFRLHRVIAIAGHEVDSFVDIYINEDRVTQIDENGNVLEVETPDGSLSSRYKDWMHIWYKLGTESQTAFSVLVDTYKDDENPKWTDDHRLRGIAAIYYRADYQRDKFPNGAPTVTAVVRGKQVYDPRTGQTKWSDNAALCNADYITAGYGLNEDSSAVNWDKVTVAADVCDQTNTPTGEKRYTVNGAFFPSSSPYEFFSSSLGAMGGLLWFSQGQWQMKAAHWTAPVQAFTEDNLRSSVEVGTRHSRRDNFNAVGGTYRGPETLYQQTDFPQITNHSRVPEETVVQTGSFTIGEYYEIKTLGTADWNTIAGTTGRTYAVGDIVRCAQVVVDATADGYETYDFFLAVDNGERSVVNHDLQFTDNYATCKRLSRIFLERNRQQLTVSAVFDLTAMNVSVGDNVSLSFNRFGWVNKVFEVAAWEFQMGEERSLEIRLTLREISEEVFDDKDTGELFERDNTLLPSPFEVSIPTTLASTSEVETDVDGKSVSDIEFTWSHPFPDSVSSYEIQWKRTTSSTYKRSAVVHEQAFSLEGVNSKISFDWRVRALNTLGVASAWADGTVASGKADELAPKAPTGISGTGAYRSVQVSWVAPTQNTDNTSLDDLKGYDIYRDGVFLASTSGTSFTDNSLLSATNYGYKVLAYDFTGNVSAFSETVNIVTLADPADGVSGNSVKPVYSTVAAPTDSSQLSFTPGTKEYVNYYEYSTASGAPLITDPALLAVTYVKFVGVGQSIWTIYADNATGDNPSLTQGTKVWVNFYEKEGDAPVIVGNLIDGVASSTLTWVKFIGEDGASAKTFSVSADSLIMTYDGEGEVDPALQTITLTANKQNIVGTVSWSTSPDVKIGTGDTFTLTQAHFGTSYSSANKVIEVTATVDTFTDSVTLVALKQGSGAITVVQTNESHGISASPDGTPTTFVGSENNYRVYQGTRQLTPETGDSSPPKGQYTIINAGITYVNCSGPSAETVDVDSLLMGPITDITADTAYRDVLIRVGSYPAGDPIDITVRQSFTRVKSGDTGVTGARGPGRWDIILPAGIALPNSTSNSAKSYWNTYGHDFGNDAPVRPVVDDQAWFRDETGKQKVFICDTVSSDLVHTWVWQDEVIDGNLLVGGTLTVMDAAVNNTVEGNYNETSETGWQIRKDGSATFFGPVISRPLVINEGSFVWDGTLYQGGSQTFRFVNTGIRVGADDVWKTSRNTLLATVQVLPNGVGNLVNGGEGNLWAGKAEVYNTFNFLGQDASWGPFRGLEYPWSEDPDVLVDPSWAAGTDQRVMMDVEIFNSQTIMSGPITISWKVYQVT